MLDVEEVRKEFPALQRKLGDRQVVFADNAATSLKPRCVIDAVDYYYNHVCANVHRGINVLAQEADSLYEEARSSIAELINARPEELVFVRNATEAINLAAHIIGPTGDDEVVCSLGDHHSNFLPWFTRAGVRVVVPDDEGRVTKQAFVDHVTPRTKLVALGHVSNVTGIVLPVADIIREVGGNGVLTLVDGAQSVTHMPIDVRELGCDFFAFSGHKMLGPSGIGVLYARRELLEAAEPMLFGGGMVLRVTPDGYETEAVPHKFEAGTPNIEGALGMGAAARFLMELGMEDVHRHAAELTEALVAELQPVEQVRTYPQGTSANRLPIVSLGVPGLSADDVAAILCNRYGIMVRSGVHCAEPLVRHFGVNGLARVSLHLYNTVDEVHYIGDSLRKLCRFLG
jgi:cysteine desulfurase/selenocysteine lyase